MQQPCSRCGYISDRPARFCRQCGAQLVNENEITSATTRNYEARTTGGSSAEPPRTWQSPMQDAPPETARFYQPPAPGAYAPPPAYGYSAPPAPRKSSAAPWLIVLFLAALLMGGGLLGAVGYFTRNRAVRPPVSAPEEIAGLEEQRIREEIDRAMQEARQAIEEAKQQAEDGVRDGLPPAPPAPPAAPGAGSLDKYKYDKAEIVETNSFLGNDVLRMETSDPIDKVRDHYQKLAGAPIVSTRKNDEQTYIFQVPGSPSIVIIVTPSEEDPSVTNIQIARTKFMPNLKQ